MWSSNEWDSCLEQNINILVQQRSTICGWFNRLHEPEKQNLMTGRNGYQSVDSLPQKLQSSYFIAFGTRWPNVACDTVSTSHSSVIYDKMLRTNAFIIMSKVFEFRIVYDGFTSHLERGGHVPLIISCRKETEVRCFRGKSGVRIAWEII